MDVGLGSVAAGVACTRDGYGSDSAASGSSTPGSRDRGFVISGGLGVRNSAHKRRENRRSQRDDRGRVG
jgi:hypothetical protein